MYDEFAHLWPLIGPPEEYATEAMYWRAAVRDKLGPGRHEVLELGVGGGSNLHHMTRDFNFTAVDLSEKMLAHSIRLNPDVEHHVGDMRSVRLGRKFDVVMIGDALAYLTTEADLTDTFATARSHLEHGGVFVLAPDWFREDFVSPRVFNATRREGAVELTWVEYAHDPDPSDTLMESVFVYFIDDSDGLRVETDRHVMGLFPRRRWIELLELAGFSLEVKPITSVDHHQGTLLVGELGGNEA